MPELTETVRKLRWAIITNAQGFRACVGCLTIWGPGEEINHPVSACVDHEYNPVIDIAALQRTEAARRK